MRTMWILWPSFIGAAVGTVFFFTLFDQADLELSRTAGYTTAFFFFWALAAGSSSLTCLLQQRAEEINRCPLQAVERPLGCPRREEL